MNDGNTTETTETIDDRGRVETVLMRLGLMHSASFGLLQILLMKPTQLSSGYLFSLALLELGCR